MIVHQAILAQIPVPDSVRIHMDTVPPRQAVEFPVLSDTTQYNDTNIVKRATRTDTIVRKKVHSPRKATIRSLIIPGWGQVYNKKYWKVPLVYAAIGIPAYLYFDNKAWYNRAKYAISITANNRSGNADSMALVHPNLKILVESGAQANLVRFRNEVRKDMDYSILFTILMWGLNIVDATVDGHLKGFDVSDDLSLKLKPSMQQGLAPGLSLVVRFK